MQPGSPPCPKKKAVRAPLTCDDCGRTLKSRDGFEYHINWHRGVKPFACPECPYRSFGSIQLREHVRTVHRGPGKPPPDTSLRQCRDCEFATRNTRSASMHARSCRGIVKHRDCERHCDECGSSFAKWTALVMHVPACSRRRSDSPLLEAKANTSLLSRSLVDDETSLRCHICSRGYKNQKKLLVHLTYHRGGQGRANCDQCGKSFESLTGLVYHIKTHYRPAGASVRGRRPRPPKPEALEPSLELGAEEEIDDSSADASLLLSFKDDSDASLLVSVKADSSLLDATLESTILDEAWSPEPAPPPAFLLYTDGEMGWAPPDGLPFLDAVRLPHDFASEALYEPFSSAVSQGFFYAEEDVKPSSFSVCPSWLAA